MKYFKCGHIMTTHGIKGDLKIKPSTDFDLFILHQGNYEEVIVKKTSNFKDYLLVSFEGLLDINLVQKYHSNDIYVSEDNREQLNDDEFYYSDLIGLELINQHNESRGKVIEIRELPQACYLVVYYNNKSYMIPFIEEFILEIDDKIHINEIEGLFWK